MTSNIIYIVAFGVGFKCPRKIHLNTQWGGEGVEIDQNLVHVVVECPLMPPQLKTKQLWPIVLCIHLFSFLKKELVVENNEPALIVT